MLTYSENIKVIDFIGASGSGKTTLANAFFEHHQNIEKDILKVSNKNLKNTDILKNEKSNQLIKELLQEKKKTNPSEGLLRYYASLLTIDQNIINSNSAKLFIADDGITHIFDKEILNLTNENLIKQAFLSRVIILIEQSTDKIIENLKNRNQKTPGAANDWLGYCVRNKFSISHIIEKSKERKIKMLEHAKINHALTYKIELKSNIKDNINQLTDIIKGLSLDLYNKTSIHKESK